MITTALFVLAAYLCVGVPFGNLFARYSLKVWKNKESSLASALLFPISTAMGKVGKLEETLVEDCSAEDYRQFMSYFWPVKLAWLPIVWFIELCMFGVMGYVALSNGKGAVLLPHVAADRLLNAAKEKLEARRAVKALPPAEPPTAQSPAVLAEQARIEEIERLKRRCEELQRQLNDRIAASEVESCL